MKKIILLGATGSIGMQTMDVVNCHNDRFKVVGVSAGKNMKRLSQLITANSTIRYVCVEKKTDMEYMQNAFPQLIVFYGEDGLSKLAALDDYDIFVNAIVGFRGLVPTLTAIEHQKVIALANKETLVAGGPLIKKALRDNHVPLYPIDSEHSAIFQCLQGNQNHYVDKLIITASGGSFRDYTREELQSVTIKQALNHPNWQMGARITIDSATMMNKGFEVIEAHYLFDIPYDQIEVLIHRESVIHSMVQFRDHAIMAQLGSADMRLPIQYALSYPERLQMYHAQVFDFMKYPSLHFHPANELRYPLLKLAFDVGKKGGNLGAVMNGADEEAVAMFLNNQISFLDIEQYVMEAVQAATYIEQPCLQDLIDADHFARAYVKDKGKGVIS